MHCYTTQSQNNIAIIALTTERLETWLNQQNPTTQRWLNSISFKAKSGEVALLPQDSGNLKAVLLGVDNPDDFWAFGVLPKKLPAGTFYIDNRDNFLNAGQYQRAQLAWGLGSYQFKRYLKRDDYPNQLHLAEDADIVNYLASSIFLLRDLINTPADDMGTEELAKVVKQLAHEHKASFSSTKGRALQNGYPAIYAVGRAGYCEPQLLDLHWGHKSHPKITLVGKGITFDTGGLDLKSASGMRLMKKDMGGAAHAIALARMIMRAKLPVCLRLLVPTAENAIDSRSYHPGDVIQTRAGHSVEIENTDAEGRLILADALTAASEASPDYLINFATLTGAATVALGPDIPAMYTNHNPLAEQLLAASQQVCDPLWQMPLHQPYLDFLKSDIADILSASSTGMGGSITAALFLQKFVPDSLPWIHFDLLGYNKTAKIGRNVGAEAMAIRAVFHFLAQKFTQNSHNDDNL